MSFVPPFFSKIGKPASDLLAKKKDDNDLKHQLSVVSKAANGITVTSTATAETAAVEKLSGKVQVKKEDKSWGEASIEFATSLKTKATLKLTQLFKGLTVNAEGEVSVAKPNVTDFSGKLSADYAQENVAASAEYDYGKNNASLSLTGGFDGLTAGGQLNVSTKALFAKPAAAPTTPSTASSTAAATPAPAADAAATPAAAASSAYWFLPAVQYQEGDLTFALAMEKKEDIAFSALHKISKTTSYGARFLVADEASLTFGGEYALSDVTSTKAKAQVFANKEFLLYGSVQHKLADPKLQLTFASQWAPLSCPDRAKANAFAVTVSLGDN